MFFATQLGHTVQVRFWVEFRVTHRFIGLGVWASVCSLFGGWWLSSQVLPQAPVPGANPSLHGLGLVLGSGILKSWTWDLLGLADLADAGIREFRAQDFLCSGFRV